MTEGQGRTKVRMYEGTRMRNADFGMRNDNRREPLGVRRKGKGNRRREAGGVGGMVDWWGWDRSRGTRQLGNRATRQLGK
jgi:hypothetical protein